jgi:hypothetical protein
MSHIGTQQLDSEIARLQELALRSSDPLIIAKAIAAKNSDVRQLMISKLEDGQSLVEVIAYHATGSRTTVHVFFRFAKPGSNVRLVDIGFLAVVDSTRGEVSGTVDPYDLQPEQTPMARPFVLVSPPDTSQFTAEGPVHTALVERQRTFLQALRIEPFGRTIYTVDRTIFGTETWCDVGNGRRAPDDTTQDQTCDYNDCAMPGTIIA